MPRLLFSKTGNAVWISHLDLMRLFQRAFKRAELPLKHTQGYNPRPSVSIALPLSVGVESKCELLDFDLDSCLCNCLDIKDRLQPALVDGISVLDCYDDGRKTRDIAFLKSTIILEYNKIFCQDTVDAIQRLFESEQLCVTKKSKNGPVEQNIVPMIRQINVLQTGASSVSIDAVVCCQNPSLNPMLLVQAIEKFIPQHKPDFSKCIREEIYDNAMNVFR